MIDLRDAPVIDTHLHGWRTEELIAAPSGGFAQRVTMLGMCVLTSGGDPATYADALREATATTPLALALLARLAERLGCEPSEEAVEAARLERLRRDPTAYLQELWRDARIEGLVVDEGFPLPIIPPDELARAAGVPVHRVVRIEPWIAEERERASGYDDLEDALSARLEHAAAADAIAFKSVIAYRTGLDVTQPSADEARAAFARWRDDGFRETRTHAKPVRDRLLERTLAVASASGVPVHIHSGGGDPDSLVPYARPAGLFDLLKRHAQQPVLLIHAGWPWTDEAAFLASILPHVHLDLSIGIPWASLAIDRLVETALGVAPPAKVLYGSDEASEPEVAWFSALVAREALERVLASGVERRWMTPAQATRIGEDVLAGNCRRLHGLAAP
jgi:predicted TIM-barrel fold metal-dependent hydrolase